MGSIENRTQGVAPDLGVQAEIKQGGILLKNELFGQKFKKFLSAADDWADGGLTTLREAADKYARPREVITINEGQKDEEKITTNPYSNFEMTYLPLDAGYDEQWASVHAWFAGQPKFDYYSKDVDPADLHPRLQAVQALIAEKLKA